MASKAYPKSESKQCLHCTLYTLCYTLFFHIHPSFAFATQEHGAGLPTHPMALAFFACSLGFLIYWMRRHGLVAAKGWRYIQYAALMLIILNVQAFWGYWLLKSSGWIETRRGGAMTTTLHPVRGHERLIPFCHTAKLDYMICVPSLLLPSLGLRCLLHEPAEPGQT